MHVLLRKIDPDQGMTHWYMITVQATLLEPLAVVCAYGSWETPWQQLRVLPVSSSTEAQDLADTILDRKLNQGSQVMYEAMSSKNPLNSERERGIIIENLIPLTTEPDSPGFSHPTSTLFKPLRTRPFQAHRPNLFAATLNRTTANEIALFTKECLTKPITALSPGSFHLALSLTVNPMVSHHDHNGGKCNNFACIGLARSL